MNHLVLLVLAFVLHTSTAEPEVIETDLGTIRGKTSGNVIEFLGIPYAVPLSKANRFQPPQPVQNWTEDLDATSYGPACPQNIVELDSRLSELETTEDTFEDLITEIRNMDEDCLYLNIYKNASTIDLLPVMVYIHGGDFVAGSGMEYSGSNLVENDVIVVTMNYRLGALGFLSDGTDALPGNYGILDQQMAIKWIHDNIEAFGGDPNLITIFGSGAGGSSVHLHTVIESSTPYFNRAIIQSATYNDAVWRKETAKEQHDALLEELEVDTTELRDMNASDIVDAIPGPWQPVISDLIPNQPRYSIKENSDIDILVGSDSLDGYSLTESIDVSAPNWYYDAIEDLTSMTSEFYNWTTEDVDQRTQMFKQYYGGMIAGVDVPLDSMFSLTTVKTQSLTQIYTDQLYESWAQEVAMSQSAVCDCSVYKYHFKQSLSSESTTLVAGDGLLVYLFGFGPVTPVNKRSLSRRVMAMWTQFALNGTIPQEGTTEYETFTPYATSNSCRSAIDIGIEGDSISEDLIAPRNWEFWKRYYAALGFSCLNDSSTETENGGEESVTEICEAGVWSDAGVVMSNEVAGALLITFICLTAVALLMFLVACHKNRKAKRKIKKVLSDDLSSVISNASSKL